MNIGWMVALATARTEIENKLFVLQGVLGANISLRVYIIGLHSRVVYLGLV